MNKGGLEVHMKERNSIRGFDMDLSKGLSSNNATNKVRMSLNPVKKYQKMNSLAELKCWYTNATSLCNKW